MNMSRIATSLLAVAALIPVACVAADGRPDLGALFPGAKVDTIIKAGVAEGMAEPRRVQVYDMPMNGRVKFRVANGAKIVAGEVLFIVEEARVQAGRRKYEAERSEAETARRQQSLEYRKKVSEMKRTLEETETYLTIAEKREKDPSLLAGADEETRKILAETNRRGVASLKDEVSNLKESILLMDEAEIRAGESFASRVEQARIDWENIERNSVVKADFDGIATVLVEELLDGGREAQFRAQSSLVVVEDDRGTQVQIPAVSQPWAELRTERLFAAPRLPSGQAPVANFKEMRPGRTPDAPSKYTFSFPTGVALRQLHGKPLAYDIYYNLGAPHQIVSKSELYKYDPKLDFSHLMQSFNSRHRDWIMSVEGHAECAIFPASLAAKK